MTKKGANIAKAMTALEKRFGEKVVLKMSDSGTSVDTFSSGRPDLDLALGGGYGIGKIIEIYSEEAMGKTGLALEAIKSIQDDGGIAAIIDAEHALNIEYCEQVGVNVKDLYISQPSHGEQAFETIRALINTAEIDLIVTDSVPALIPRRELEGETGEAMMGVQAKMMGQGLKQITGAASEVGCTVIFLNQLRDNMSPYGAKKITPGGKALKFFASQRLVISSKGQIKEGEEVIGFKQFIKIIKNKIGVPFQTVENDIIYGKGVDSSLNLVDTLVESGIIEKSGSWYSYEGAKLGNGMKKLRAVLAENPDLLEELTEKLKNL